jgi:hypothetical protein
METSRPAFAPHKFKKLVPLGNTVIVSGMEFTGRQLASGIVLLNDNGTTAGIRPRWAQVYAVGSEQTHFSEGQWICIAHGRWTRGVEVEDPESGEVITIRKVDPKDILLCSDTKPADSTMSDAIQASIKDRW